MKKPENFTATGVWTEKRRETASRTTAEAMHRRWHVGRGLVKEGCEWCELRPEV